VSTYWDLDCKTCNCTVLYIHANHGEKGLSELAADAAKIVEAAKLCPHLLIDLDHYNVYPDGRGTFSASRLLPHEGHEMVPRNEYGDWAKDCNKYVSCSACGCEHHRCKLPIGHNGECKST